MAGLLVVAELMVKFRLRYFPGLWGTMESQCNQLVNNRSFSTRVTRLKRLEKLGIGPDGKPLPIANPKGIFPRMYKCLIVNQDGSTYHAFHPYPHKIITLPLDPSTLSEEERMAREKRKRRSKEHHYVSEEDDLEEEWDHSQYKDLLR